VSAQRDGRPLGADEIRSILQDAVEARRLEAKEAARLGARARDPLVRGALVEAAWESAREGRGDTVTVSRNVFIPLTNLCRNRCSYCTFAKQPGSPEAHTYGLDEVAEVVRGGVATGCTEALMCLGDKPEIAYKSFRQQLEADGYSSTTDLLVEACRVAFEGGMLPHTNAGILSSHEMERLRPFNASMGLMMETTSQRLRGKGMPHQYAPDKEPARRIRMHEEAGELKIPFTSGLLLGIGENDEERADTLAEIRRISDAYGHIQEVIVQPFHPKPGTRMRHVAPLADEEVVAWTAIARLVMGPDMNVQAPPNLGADVLPQLLRAGINDWGGVSPVTLDYINPEAPWPTLPGLREVTEEAGLELRDRGPIYPDWVPGATAEADPGGREEFYDPQMRDALPRFFTADGHARRAQTPSGEEAA
jgi:FO synthase